MGTTEFHKNSYKSSLILQTNSNNKDYEANVLVNQINKCCDLYIDNINVMKLKCA